MSVERPYPANLCPLSGVVEFADFGEDLGQAIGELIKTMSGRAVRQRATEHLNSVLGEQERIYSTFETCARRDGGRLRLWNQVAGLRAGQVELTLQVITDDQNVLHGHLRLDVAKQRHKRRQTHARAHHFSGVCVSELVRHNPCTDTDGSDNIGKVRTQLFDKGLLVARAGQEPAVKWEGIKRAEEA